MPNIQSDQLAIQRKIRASGVSTDRFAWTAALSGFKQRLRGATFGALILDYDGTIVDAEHRHSAPTRSVATAIIRILEAELPIGIATGRGISVRADLLRCIPATLARGIWIGYYNAGVIAQLTDLTQPEQSNALDPSLQEAADVLGRDAQLRSIAQITARPPQITVEAKSDIAQGVLWSMINELLTHQGSVPPRVVASSHSVDVLADGVSKCNLVRFMKTNISKRAADDILCIGDRGRWPGNDFELLAQPHSLSVDEVSADMGTCWNLCTPGLRGSKALVQYLSWLHLARGEARMALPTA